eukprot:CAMPEP_0170516326 /NCGR_PEP_ID=MMETSP0209-20121228/2565_1 /TAXON_ID=665100 ORGANISM="Litonotus pictus, Strain P1" /NCGR_SAMPLE_ID=MMETSP0209 /ASSEMBLY_ACC=CAM_ASM_000301 /LENGTH=188 /DNA_ID=CAMNT_0010801155 /DNA_START=264 /DNA_END=830 /DNA_ORIENTATION=+
MPEDEVKAFVGRLRSVFHSFSKIKIPTIACINGYALGGGLELALACDIRLGTKASYLGLPEAGLGIIPGAGGSQRLSRVIGIPKAKELILIGRRIDGEEAFKIGLLNHVFATNEDMENYCLDISSKIQESAPLAVQASKGAIDEGYTLPIEKALEVEEKYYDVVLKTEDRIEGLKAFLEKRKTEFRGV